jgi:hypothetical protein
MAWEDYNKDKNAYFHFDRDYAKDRELYDLLSTEAINKNGTCLEYYTSTYSTSKEQIFGEDDDRRYRRKFSIMGYYELPKEVQMWTKWGIEGLDNFKIHVTKRHFNTATSGYTPKVGDLVRARYNNVFYEIIDVGEEEEMFLRQKHSWEFIVKPFIDTRVRLSADTSATMTILSAHTNQEDDLFDIKDVIDSEKTDVLYREKSTDQSVDPRWDDW